MSRRTQYVLTLICVFAATIACGIAARMLYELNKPLTMDSARMQLMQALVREAEPICRLPAEVQATQLAELQRANKGFRIDCAEGTVAVWAK